MTKKGTFFRYAMLMMRKNHNSNKRKGVYNYMLRASLKIIGIYLIIVVPFILIMKRLVDFNNIFQFLTDNFSDAFVFVLFTISESFLGMIPPDFFVIWAAKFNSPFLFLSLLGILSYAGGVFSYFIGHWLAETPRIKAYSERVLDKYIILVRKWGGAFIIIAALFPFSPYSMVVMAVALLKYPFRLYLLFAISRIARFLIQGVLYLDILKIDTFFG